MVKLYALAPIIESESLTEVGYQKFLDQEFAAVADIDVIGRFLKIGPSSVESELDDALAIPGLVQAGLQALNEGAQGILIDCMLDPGLKALRTALTIPVMGTAEISYRLASALGGKFGIIDVCDDTGPMVEAQVRAMGLISSFAGLRSTDLRVEEIEQDHTLTMDRLTAAALQVITKDGAEVIVLGCTEFSHYAAALRQQLLAQGADVPIINPTTLSIGVLAAVVRAGATHSKRTYPSPKSRKTLRGFALPSLYDGQAD